MRNAGDAAFAGYDRLSAAGQSNDPLGGGST
jgi:hypothetical protein